MKSNKMHRIDIRKDKWRKQQKIWRKACPCTQGIGVRCTFYKRVGWANFGDKRYQGKDGHQINIAEKW